MTLTFYSGLQGWRSCGGGGRCRWAGVIGERWSGSGKESMDRKWMENLERHWRRRGRAKGRR